ncbi:alpha/beta fold hydrolase [Variovorax sp. E3]|uniref:alpha/beta fold hydrolase n=1 Tax=Variovorax sp. E3 TaxID=1914993 RepID=UPI0035B40551
MPSSSLHYEVHGPSDAAATVLLSSGLGGSAGFWQPQLGALIAAGHRVIAYDQRGTGRSPAALPEAYAIEHMAQDVLEILDATQTTQCHFAGHALGGLVGLRLALDAPARVASLVLVNAWAKPNPHSARCFDTRLALLGAVGPRATWKRSRSSCTPPRGARPMRSAWPTRSTTRSRTSPARPTCVRASPRCAPSTSTRAWPTLPRPRWRPPPRTTCSCPGPARSAWPRACRTPRSTSWRTAATRTA